MSQYTYKPLGCDELLLNAWARSGSLSFQSEPENILVCLQSPDYNKWCRVLVTKQNELAATIFSSPVGLNIENNSVKAEAVGFVCVPPEHRGKRASVEIMREHLHEAHTDGAALSVLYSARARLYRGVGYETAGRRSVIQIPLRTLKARSMEGADRVNIREMSDDDHGKMKELYKDFASQINGYLDRGQWHWDYTLGGYAKKKYPGFIFEQSGTITGYMILTKGQSVGEKHGSEMGIHDIAFTDAPTARSMIRFLSGFSSTRSMATLGADTTHPLFDHIDELWYQVASTELWMIRILDIERAVSQRGYNPCLTGDVVVEISDPILKHNNTRWHISVADGKGTATQTDAPTQASMDISAFAAIFTGYSTATQTHNSGRLEASSDAINVLNGLFNAPTPVMADDF